WLTPGRDWQHEYSTWPAALAKLRYCDRTLARVADVDPLVTSAELDEDVGELTYSIREYYQNYPVESEPPAGLDGDLRAIFEDLSQVEQRAAGDCCPAAALIRRLERQLMADIFRWTGHFPERTRALMRHLA